MGWHEKLFGLGFFKVLNSKASYILITVITLMFFLSQQRLSKNNPKNMLNKYIEQMLKNRTATKNMLNKWYLFFYAILTHPHQFKI